jgi:effector-binding domain-containing protein
MLRLKQAEVEQQMLAEQQRLARIEARLRLIEQETAESSSEVIVRPIEPYLVAAIYQRRSGNSSIPCLFEQLEKYVARYRARAAAPPLTIYHVPADQWTNEGEGQPDVEIAIPISAPLPVDGLVTVRELEALPVAACLVHTGSYETLDQTAVALLRWIEAHGYEVAGPTRELYLRFGADNEGYTLPAAYLAAEVQEFVTELQIPVTKK